MSLDVVDLRSFYVHPLGKVARRFVGVGIRRLWSSSRGLRILGIGYSIPYLGLFREDAVIVLEAEKQFRLRSHRPDPWFFRQAL